MTFEIDGRLGAADRSRPAPEWTSVRVTRKQARAMAEAIWSLQQRVALYAEIAGVRDGTTVKDQIALAEIRRRLYLAADYS